MLNGFDASGWSGNINMLAAKRAGMKFAWFRVGRGQADGASFSNRIDKRWEIYRSAAAAVELYYGGYWRFFPNLNLEAQVDQFVAHLRQQPGMLPPLFDIEQTANKNPTQLTDWVLNGMRMLERKLGRKPLLYTYKNFLDNNLEYWRLDEFEQCIAWQTGNTAWPEYGAVFWQYKLDTPAPWASGNIDYQKFALNNLKLHTFNHDLLYHFDEHGMLHGPRVYNNKLLPESGSQGRQPNHTLIYHTMVGYLNGTDSYFRRWNIGSESTFGTGGRYDGASLDGAIYQWMRIFERADANGDANAYGASIESSDGGGVRYKQLWSPKQAESHAQIGAAWCIKYNRPARLIRRAVSTERGIAYHRQGVEPYSQPGSDSWSSSYGKVCPGFERSDQLESQVIPRIANIVESVRQSGGGGSTPPGGDEVSADDVWNHAVFSRVSNKDVPAHQILTGTDFMAYQTRANTQQLLTELTELKNTINEQTALQNEKIDQAVTQLSNLLYILDGQPSWNDLSTVTWDDLATEPWAKLGS